MSSSGGIALASLLPAPAQNAWDRDEERQKARAEEESAAASTAVATFVKTAPPYGAR